MATLPTLSLRSLQKRQPQQPKNRLLYALFDLDGAVVAASRRPLWLASLVLAASFALLPPLSFLTSAARGDGISVVMRQELSKSGKLDKLTPEQRAGFDRVVVPATTVFLPVGAVVKRLLWICACALVCLAFLHGTRPHLSARSIIAVAVVGAAPWYVNDVVSAVTLLSFDVGSIDPSNAVASNPAAWLFSGKDSRTPLAVLLRGVDFFDLWGCAWLTAALTRHAGGRTSLPALVVFGGHIAATVKDAVAAAAAG